MLSLSQLDNSRFKKAPDSTNQVPNTRKHKSLVTSR